MNPQYPPPPPHGYYQQQHWHPGPPPPPEEKRVDLLRILGINFGIFITYQALIVAVMGDWFILFDWLLLGLHALTVLILMIVMFSRGRRMKGFGYLASLGLIIIVGIFSMFMLSEILGTPNFHF